MRKDLEEYEGYLYQQELLEATVSVYMRVAKEFLDYIGEEKINKDVLIRYKEYLQNKKLAVTTINQHIIAVNRYLRYSGYGGCVLKTNRIQRQTSIDNVLSEKDYRRLLAYVKEHRDDKYYAIIKTLALTGIRVSELRYITAEKMESGHIVVKNKGKSREIFLPDSLLAILKQYCREHGITSGSIFLGNKGQAISRMAVWSKLNKLAEKAGIERKKGHPHGLRHYFALLYMKKYSNLFELADILGHSSLETTRIYTTATVEEKRKRMGRLDC